MLFIENKLIGIWQMEKLKCMQHTALQSLVFLFVTKTTSVSFITVHITSKALSLNGQV